MLNEGALALTTVPSTGLDATDGKITVRPVVVAVALPSRQNEIVEIPRESAKASPLVEPARRSSVDFEYPLTPALSDKMFPAPQLQKIVRSDDRLSQVEEASIDWNSDIPSDEFVQGKKRSRVETLKTASARNLRATDSVQLVKLQPNLAKGSQKLLL